MKIIIFPYQITNNFTFDLFSIVDYNTNIDDTDGNVTYRLNNSVYPMKIDIVDTYDACTNKFNNLTIQMDDATLENCTIALVRGNINIESSNISVSSQNPNETLMDNPTLSMTLGNVIIYNPNYKTNGYPEYIYCNNARLDANMETTSSATSFDTNIILNNITSWDLWCVAMVNTSVNVASQNSYLNKVEFDNDKNMDIDIDKDSVKLFTKQIDFHKTEEHNTFNITNVDLTEFITPFNGLNNALIDAIKDITTIYIYAQDFSIIDKSYLGRDIVVKYKQSFETTNEIPLTCKTSDLHVKHPYNPYRELIGKILIPVTITFDEENKGEKNINLYFTKEDDNDMLFGGTSFDYNDNYTLITEDNTYTFSTTTTNTSLNQFDGINLYSIDINCRLYINEDFCDNIQLLPKTKITYNNNETKEYTFKNLYYDFGIITINNCLIYENNMSNRKFTYFYGDQNYNLYYFKYPSNGLIELQNFKYVFTQLDDSNYLTIELNKDIFEDVFGINLTTHNKEGFVNVKDDKLTYSYELSDNIIELSDNLTSTFNSYSTNNNKFVINNSNITINIKTTEETNYEETINNIPSDTSDHNKEPLDTVINKIFTDKATYNCKNLIFNDMAINILSLDINNNRTAELYDLSGTNRDIPFSGDGFSWAEPLEDEESEKVKGEPTEPIEIPLEDIPEDYDWPDGITREECDSIFETTITDTSVRTVTDTKYEISNLTLHINNNKLNVENDNSVNIKLNNNSITFTITGTIKRIINITKYNKTYSQKFRYYYFKPVEPEYPYSDFFMDIYDELNLYSVEDQQELIELLNNDVIYAAYGDEVEGETLNSITIQTTTYNIKNDSYNNIIFNSDSDNIIINTGILLNDHSSNVEITLNNVNVETHVNELRQTIEFDYTVFNAYINTTLLSTGRHDITLNKNDNPSIINITDVSEVDDNIFDEQNRVKSGITGSLTVTDFSTDENAITIEEAINGDTRYPLIDNSSSIEYITTSTENEWNFVLSDLIDISRVIEPEQPYTDPYPPSYIDLIQEYNLESLFSNEELNELVDFIKDIPKDELNYYINNIKTKSIYVPDEVTYSVKFTSSMLNDCEISIIYNDQPSIEAYRTTYKNTNILNILNSEYIVEFTGEDDTITLPCDQNSDIDSPVNNVINLMEGTISYVGKIEQIGDTEETPYIINLSSKTYDFNGLINRNVDTGFSTSSYVSLLKYSSANLDINNHMVVYSDNKFDTIYSQEFAKEILLNNIKIITNYDEENNYIEYSREIIPVRINMELISSLNSPLRNSNKSELYTTAITKPCINVKNNEILPSTETRIHINNIDNDCYYNSFNCIRSSIMDYISIPKYTITIDTNNIFSIENTYSPVIKGNKLITFVYTNNTLLSNTTNENVPINTATFYSTETTNNKLDFYNKLKLNICFTYSNNVDSLLNNNNNYNNVVFNIISEDEDYTSEQNQYRIKVNRNVNLSNNGVSIYVTSDKFQYPFISNLSMIKYSYLE